MNVHKWNILLAMALLVAAFPACNYLKTVALLSDGESGFKGEVEVPFTYASGLILVDGRVSGQEEPRALIFDTGAFDCKIAASWAEASGMSPLAERDNSAARGRSKRLSLARADSLWIGGAFFQRMGVGLLHYDSLSASRCLGPGGLVGGNLIRQVNWIIDYPERRLLLSKPPLKIPAGAFRLPFRHPVLSGKPTVALKVGGKEVAGVLLDTGYNGGLSLPIALLPAFAGYPADTLIDQSSSGIYGPSIAPDTLIRIVLPIAFGPMVVPAQVEFSGGGAYLGNEVLQYFDLYLDYSRKEAAFYPNGQVPEVELTHDFVPAVLNDSLWRVARCRLGGPLVFGDTLHRVNGLRPKALGSGYCNHFLQLRELLKQDSLFIERADGQGVLLSH